MDHGVVPPTLNPALFKRAAGVAGAVLTLIAGAMLVRRGIELGDRLGQQLTLISPIRYVAAVTLYTAGALLLGAVWVSLVRLGCGERIAARPLFAVHLQSQLAKYLPGNIFHLAYRHITARREGVGHRALGFALAMESLMLIVAAAILALGVVLDPRIASAAPWARGLVWGAPLVLALAWVCLGIVGRRSGVAWLVPRRTAFPLILVLAMDLAFFLLAAMALRSLCDTPSAMPPAAWCGWLALAWAVGYVTPGAPAGLGLREAVLTLGLAPVLGEAQALALALEYRLTTVAADGVLALVGFAAPRLRAEH